MEDCSENEVHLMDFVISPVMIAEVHLETRKNPVAIWVYELTMNGMGNHVSFSKLKQYLKK